MAIIFQHITWWDLLDILVTAFFIHRVLGFIRNPMLARLLLALVGLILALLFARLTALATAASVAGSFLTSFVVVTAIVFQADIRRALYSIDRSAAATPLGDEVPEAIEEVVSAAVSLAARRIGALIVMQRRMDLSPFVEVGTDIDAKVTSELITSIFLPYSPIHDGAVLVREGKITHAGCFLPLTRNPTVDKSLGTRHRAALGLTEVVDAVVVVVSEETGRISLVFGGRITPVPEPSTFRKMLLRMMEGGGQSAGS